MKTLFYLLLAAWLVLNFITSKLLSSRQLAGMVLSGNCLAGKIFSMVFYSPAWILKAIREIILWTVK